jgi:hypothetical protein
MLETHNLVRIIQRFLLGVELRFDGSLLLAPTVAGPLVGTPHGGSWIPTRWHDNIENGKYGRDEIVSLARRLAAVTTG